jgi:hypothetical protein
MLLAGGMSRAQEQAERDRNQDKIATSAQVRTLLLPIGIFRAQVQRRIANILGTLVIQPKVVPVLVGSECLSPMRLIEATMAAMKVQERESNFQLAWDFIELCIERNTVDKYREFNELVNQQYDKSMLMAICKYQLSLPFRVFVSTGFEGPAA